MKVQHLVSLFTSFVTTWPGTLTYFKMENRMPGMNTTWALQGPWKLKLLKIEHILKLNEVKFYYKLQNEKLPAYFLDQPILQNNPNKCENTFSLKINNEIREHNTRSINKIHITIISHSFAQTYLRQNLPHTINKHSVHILNKKNPHSIQRITNDIKELCIADYTEKCYNWKLLYL